METTFFSINCKPGINRDGTVYDSDQYIDGQWVRFYKGKPKKIGGYIRVDQGNDEIIRKIFVVPRPAVVDVYLGRASSISYTTLNLNGAGLGETSRTPLIDFTPDPNNIWSIDQFNVDIGGGELVPYVVAQVSSNGDDIAGNVEGGVFYGPVNTPTPLVPVNTTPALITSSGGIVTVPPYLFKYGNGIQWSNKNDPTIWTTTNFYNGTGIKFVAGFSVRGGGVPSGLFWTTSSIIRATLNPSITNEDNFSFDTISSNISILSQNCIVEVNGQYFWPGNGQFFVYNGVVNTVPNETNANYFFDNLNYDAREKVFGWYNPRYKEIWWHYPSGTSTECDSVIIFQLDQNYWFDTKIDRSAAYSQNIYPKPLLADSVPNIRDGNFYLWQHETGVDRSSGGLNYAIPSYHESKLFNLSEMGGNKDVQMKIRRVEPDFVQVGDMNLVINSRAFPVSDPVSSQLYTFSPSDGKIDTFNMGRFVSFRFESNSGGGDYLAGKINVDIIPGDVRPGS